MSEKRVPLSGFKECDVRGDFGGEITGELAYRLGRAVGSDAADEKVVVGGDFRVSTPELMAELIRGLVDSGAVAVDLGQVSTPCYYFARRRLRIQKGIMVTASHSPAGYNGFKPILKDLPITPEELGSLRDRVAEGMFHEGRGRVERVNVKSAYVDWLAGRFAGAGLESQRMVFDCGNGATGWVIGDVIDRLGIPAKVLFEQPDGTFPNRSPDIAGPKDLALLQEEVECTGAALGAGFDGDGDRVGFVDEKGRRVASDRLIAWLGRELLKTDPGSAVVYDVKLSKAIPETVEAAGGRPVVQKSGHTFIKTAVVANGAILGGEYTGHLFYRELDAGDDGLFSALYVASLVAGLKKPFSQLLSDIPVYCSTPDLRVRFSGDKRQVLEGALDHARKEGARLLLVDGVRAEFDEGWALIRASVTEPAFTFRFEGRSRSDMMKVAERFLAGLGELGRKVMKQVIES
jgi:phosphomannomutase / phosphoglucomutase